MLFDITNYVILFLLYLMAGCSYAWWWASRWYMERHNASSQDIRMLFTQSLLWPLTLVVIFQILAKWALDAVFTSQRYRAIKYALYYGILPWQWYEEKKHYRCSYWKHMVLNVGYALKWLFFLENEQDRAFEKYVNKNA